jgi:hypothetical protein
MEEALIGIELLLAGRENELLAAVAADQLHISIERHRIWEVPAGGSPGHRYRPAWGLDLGSPQSL